jgi:hypothetical protein
MIRRALFSESASESLSIDREHLGSGFEEENLFPGFRGAALDFFATREIKWHGPQGRLDASIVSSQVSCVNCLFPFVTSAERLALGLRQIYPDLIEVLPISSKSEPPLMDSSRPFLSFEWIGEQKYLNERSGRRGAFQTNADAIFRFRQQDDSVRLVMVEWKYCEGDLEATDKRLSSRGTNRVATYEPELTKPRCQLTLGTTAFDTLFRSPIDQLMRLQLLASAMERHREMEADIVSVLHIAPRSNSDLINPALVTELATDCECSVPAVWGRFVAPGRFHHLATEDLISKLAETSPDSDWAAYIRRRYGLVP